MKEMAPFDTENEISSWKTSLFNSGNFTDEHLDELESHLRDVLEGLSGFKLNHQEKFIIAQHRIGSEPLLCQAYNDIAKFNFRKVSWFAQAGIFMAMFIILSRMVRLITIDIVITGALENGLIIMIINLSLVAAVAALVYFAYRKAQQRENLVKANNMALMSFVLVALLYVVQAIFSPATSIIDSSVLPILWNSIAYITLFVLFVIVNIKQGKKQKLQLG